ncbi:MAG: hypothetical protein ACXVWV_06470 [Nocardioides sp.]
MDLRLIARWAGVAGGLLWLVRWILDLAGTTGTVQGLLHLTGLVLLALALAGTGAALVKTSAPWLRAIVAVAYPVLVWSVLEFLHPATNPEGIDGAFGLVVAVLFAAGLVRARRGARTPDAGQAAAPAGRRTPPQRARRPEPAKGARRAPRSRPTGSHAR